MITFLHFTVGVCWITMIICRWSMHRAFKRALYRPPCYMSHIAGLAFLDTPGCQTEWSYKHSFSLPLQDPYWHRPDLWPLIRQAFQWQPWPVLNQPSADSAWILKNSMGSREEHGEHGLGGGCENHRDTSTCRREFLSLGSWRHTGNEMAPDWNLGINLKSTFEANDTVTW